MQSDNNNTTVMLVKAFGEIIKKHRLKQNKTIYKISAECSITKESWRLIENDLIKDIKLSTLWKIAEGLDISPDVLIKELREKLGNDFSLTGLN